MKFFITLLTVFLAFCSSNFLIAEDIKYDADQIVDCYWTSDDENLYLNIKIVSGLEFPDNYSTFRTKNGQGCELTFIPSAVIKTTEDKEVKEIKLTAIVNNVDNQNQMKASTNVSSQYKSGIASTSSSYIRREVVIKSAKISLTQDASFYTFEDPLDEGLIVFKKASP